MMENKICKDANSAFVYKSPRRAESLIYQGRKGCEREDNTPWLITLADLMAILLVFCLVSLQMNSKPGQSSYIPLHRQVSTPFNTLVSIAEAKGNYSSYDLSIPLSMYHKNYTKQMKRNENEKIINKIEIPLPREHYTFEESHKIGLQRIASLWKNNESAKIIIFIPCKEPSTQQMNFVQEIVEYLTASCKVDGKNIYLKSMTMALKAPGSSAENIEVSIMKDFWTL